MTPTADNGHRRPRTLAHDLVDSLGDVVRTRRVDAARHAEESARALRETEERLRAAAAEERRHMARELHDVVAHGVSVMLIQAGAARQVLERLATLEGTGEDKLASKENPLVEH